MNKKIIITSLVFALVWLWIANAIIYEAWASKWIVTDDSISILWPTSKWKKDLKTGKIEHTKTSLTWEYENENNSKYITSTEKLIKKDWEIKYITPAGTFEKKWDQIIYKTSSTTLLIQNNWKIKYTTPTTTRIIDWNKFEYIKPTSK